MQPLGSTPVSRERVVPTEWQVRAVHGDCTSKAKVITVQAPQYRQYLLVSDFMDLVHLSFQEEAALPTNWIKDQPEGLKLQNLALATKAGPVLNSLPRNLTADVQNERRRWLGLRGTVVSMGWASVHSVYLARMLTACSNVEAVREKCNTSFYRSMLTKNRAKKKKRGHVRALNWASSRDQMRRICVSAAQKK